MRSAVGGSFFFFYFCSRFGFGCRTFCWHYTSATSGKLPLKKKKSLINVISWRRFFSIWSPIAKIVEILTHLFFLLEFFSFFGLFYVFEFPFSRILLYLFIYSLHYLTPLRSRGQNVLRDWLCKFKKLQTPLGPESFAWDVWNKCFFEHRLPATCLFPYSLFSILIYLEVGVVFPLFPNSI